MRGSGGGINELKREKLIELLMQFVSRYKKRASRLSGRACGGMVFRFTLGFGFWFSVVGLLWFWPIRPINKMSRLNSLSLLKPTSQQQLFSFPFIIIII